MDKPWLPVLATKRCGFGTFSIKRDRTRSVGKYMVVCKPVEEIHRVHNITCDLCRMTGNQQEIIVIMGVK
jgi:hypothetical protein